MKIPVQHMFAAAFLLLTINVCAAANFSGQWNTVWGQGTETTNLSMAQEGSQVTGNYAYRGGVIAGLVNDNVLRGSWSQNDGARGTFEFHLSPDGQSFQGRWRNGDSGPWAPDRWNGVRK